MRKSGSKEVGYVLIPLYLEQKAGESLEEAVARANFEEVWDILQSLQEQDEVLAELIRDMAVAKGSGKGFDDSRFSNRIAFTGPVLALESIRQAVTTRVLERLESSWDVNFGKLVKFREEHGHCRVPQTYRLDPKLAKWVQHQRAFYINGKLSSARFIKLETCGFDWDPLLTEWENNFDGLKIYKSQHGHCRVPRHHSDFPNLGAWLTRQRIAFTKSELSSDRIARLRSLGVEWNIENAFWERNFEALKDFKKENGHCRVPATFVVGDLKLGNWLRNQRSAFSKGKLSIDRITRLETIGVEWSPFASTWDKFFECLKDFKKQYGHVRVPKSSKTYPQLASWVSWQRVSYLKGELSQERIARLEALGFEWKLR